MPRFKAKGTLERNPLVDLWRHTLSRIPTFYGRLVYLASLRDPNSGYYRHQGLILSFGREESARALRESHEQVFVEWLSLPIAEKNNDLGDYLQSLEEDSEAVVDHWLRTSQYRNLIPARATQSHEAHFLQELKTLLVMVRNAYAAVPQFRGSRQLA